MSKIIFDTKRIYGDFKPMNAVNNGPAHKRHCQDQWTTNFEAYKAAKIPYARNHDASFCAVYGGEFTVDTAAIFPDFEKDTNDPDAYDFACTDEYIAVTNEAGTETFYRLGSKIEHEIKKHHTLPPKDFEKWADICKHIVMHYTKGWNNGFNYKITYWEIWNEPDQDEDDSPNKRTWGGTKEEFFRLYEITAKTLKQSFPELKIGGPALCHRLDWAEDFLKNCREKDIPLDFFSWHLYAREPGEIIYRCHKIKELLCKYGFDNTESILNEWNYIENWGDRFVYSLETIGNEKGAAFVASVISECQKAPVDMLMYYDARVDTGFNGMFTPFTWKPRKPYYPIMWFGKLYDLKEIRALETSENIYTLAGISEDGNVTSIVTYYTDDDNAESKAACLDFGEGKTFKVSLVDKDHTGEEIGIFNKLSFTLERNSVLLLEEI